jgi:nitric oxide reductase subunit B
MAMSAQTSDSLSSWWKVASVVTMAIGFALLILLTVKAYQSAPPIPAKTVDPAGTVLFTSEDVTAGQQVFLKHGLMDNGTVWGHGAYLGPDFSAQYLHDWALDVADHAAHDRFQLGYGQLSPDQRASIDGLVALELKKNAYDPATGILTMTAAGADSFKQQIARWTAYFTVSSGNGGLMAGAVSDPQELRQLTAFFAWAAGASTA